MLDFPNPPLTTGQTFTGPNNAVWQWDGVKWKASAGPSTVAIADMAPATPLAGQLWFDSTGLQTYLWYPDPTSSQWVPLNVPPASSGALNDVGRNLIHNAQFNVQQRGAGPWTTNAVYTADRWILSNSTGTPNTISVSLVALADADRTAIGDEAAVNAWQCNITAAGAAASTYVAQDIESVRRLSGKTVTLSFWARCTTGAANIGYNLFQVFGSGGSPSTAVVVIAGGVRQAITTTWARYVSAPIAVPSAVGKTFGTSAGTDMTIARFYLSAGSDEAGIGNVPSMVQTGTFQIWGVQLEIGSTATQLEKRDAQQDLALCQRFYVASASGGVSGTLWSGYVAASGVTYYAQVRFPVAMRAAPTVTLINLNNVGFPTTVAVNASDILGFTEQRTSNAATINNGIFQSSWTASADL